VSDEKTRELKKAYEAGDEEAGWAWAESRLRSEVSTMDLVRRIIMLEAESLRFEPAREGTIRLHPPEPTPEDIDRWINELHPAPIELCVEHGLPKPCRSCTYKSRVDDCSTVVYLFLEDPLAEVEARIQEVFRSTDDVRVYERSAAGGLAGTLNHIAQGGYVSRLPQGLVVALILGSEAWAAFELSSQMERNLTTTVEASGRHLVVTVDPAGRSGSPLLTGPQLRNRLQNWKP